jgi:uncharacterized membrane protein YgdD (TMEM256/DUF423 family)
MSSPVPRSTDDALPPSRIVRWLLLAGVILFSVGLYFRAGLKVAPIGTPTPVTTTTP